MSRLDPQATIGSCFHVSRNWARRIQILAVACSLIRTSQAQLPNPDSFDPNADNWIRALAVQPDGRVLVGGWFTMLRSQPRNRIARLHADGTLDLSFNPNPNGSVNSLTVQPDGRILVSGAFTALDGQPRNRIARLNPDGTLDPGFNPNADNEVLSMVVQLDGSVLVGGTFSELGGQSRHRIGRLNPDGTLDPDFRPSVDGRVNTLAIQADGRILVGGSFTTVGVYPRKSIARLNANGTLDPTFNPGATYEVYSLAIQADGRILAGGYFTTLGGQPGNRIARLNPDGTLDSVFHPEVDSLVHSMMTQADGKILASGWFTSLGGQQRSRIGRINPNGTVDSDFNPGADSSVSALTAQADGSVLLAGDFTRIAGQPRNRIARLAPTDPATNTLNYDGSMITWLRGGTAPEVWRTTFEHTTNGTQWTMLGAGTRIPGGWQLGGVSAPLGTIRARGFMAGGYCNGSGGIVEIGAGTPFISSQPRSLTSNAGTTAKFDVQVIGSAPFTFRWRKEGEVLTDVGNALGTATATLSLSGLVGSDAGRYDVVVSNTYGSVTSAVSTLVVVDPAINVQPVTQVAQLGGDVTFNVTAAGTGLHYQWRKDGVDLPDATNIWFTVTSVQGESIGDYDVVVCGSYGCVTSAVAVLEANLAFPDPGFNPNADGWVVSLATQTDGKILVGGGFTTLGGRLRTNIARLNMDGTPDPGFNPGANESVSSLVLQADGRILVGGGFTTLAGQPRNRIARLNADGTPDPGFNPGADLWVYSLAMQADGKILAVGQFTTLGGQPRNRIARLNADGTLDSEFNPDANGWVYTLAVQADGKILVCGGFTSVGGQPRTNIARINADGTVDPSFSPGVIGGGVFALGMQADGKILAVGNFAYLAGQPRSGLARLNADGTLDSLFNLGADGSVDSVTVQADGKILLCGDFTMLAGRPRNRIARLDADGTLDHGFDPGANYSVQSMAVQTDGKLLLGGNFTTLAGQMRSRIARLNNTYPATDTLNYDRTTLTWLRGGAAPEVWRTTFEHTTNGTEWTMLGTGTRIPGGWQLGGVSAALGTIRARGYAVGGQYNASGGIVETAIGVPIILIQPGSCTNDAGTTATFLVEAAGSIPISYRWRKDGVALTDGETISGTDTAVLNVSAVMGYDAGGYDLVISNAYGSVTSSVAILTVVDPIIYYQPVRQNSELGGDISFLVGAVGSDLTYQWRKDALKLPGATEPSLTVTNVQSDDVGDYDVVVCGNFGCVTSAVAFLEANLVFVDDGFNPGASGGGFSLAMQPDGKILAGGEFATLGGQTHQYIARLNADGTLDSGFNPSAGGDVYSLAVQSDGGILAGGMFRWLAGPRNFIGRLNTDGTLDPNFNPSPDPMVDSLALQANGQTLVGGSFSTIAGQPRFRIARLNADGTVDHGFDPGANWTVYSLAIQADGKILVGGGFTTLGGQPRNCIARLNPDGTLDSSFDPDANNPVTSLAVQADGKILVGGWFTALGGQPRNRIGRLNADGTLDLGFNPNANDPIYSLTLQTDGRILVSGSFTTLGGQTRNYLARLKADGTLDPSFNPSPDIIVSALALQSDGRILVGGRFTRLAGQPRLRIARLHNTGPASDTLSYDGASIAWLRSGTAPEVWRTTFEHTTNGNLWTMLGAGVRIPGGWQLVGVSVTNGTIRARGYTAGGFGNASGGIIESFMDATTGTSDFRLRLENVPGQAAQKRLIFSPRWTNRTYAPFFSTNPAAGASWTNLTSSTTNDHGTERTITDLDATGSSKIYRIQITTP